MTRIPLLPSGKHVACFLSRYGYRMDRLLHSKPRLWKGWTIWPKIISAVYENNC